ncbi:MAG: cell division protein SepF [Bifidobacteriaceae bacterium]|jgi:cell division inhibitor SepF|nr:cell division protein SepF [Bifidobacteriaceae bacterium]
MANIIDKVKGAMEFDNPEEDYTDYKDGIDMRAVSKADSRESQRARSYESDTRKRIANFSPTDYNTDATKIAKIFKQGTPVVFNSASLSEVDKNALIQFCAGLVYGLDGRIEKVSGSEDVFLITPRNTEILKDELQGSTPSFATDYFN